MHPPLLSQSQLIGVGLGIKLEVAHHALHFCTQRLQALRIQRGLRPDGRQCGKRRPCQPGQALRLAQRFVAQARIDQHQWHSQALATMHQIRPHLGLHQDAKIRFEVLQKTLYRIRRVPRLPGLQVAGLQKFQAFGAAGRGAVGKQQAHLWQLLAQSHDQHRNGTRLAQRHRVKPDRGTVVRRHWLGIAAKTFANALTITRLHHTAAQQFAFEQRLRQPHQAGIKPACHAWTELDNTLCQACQTASTGGVGLANTLHWRGDPANGPVRQAVSKL